MDKRTGHGSHLCCILLGYLVSSSSSLTASTPVSVSSMVGSKAVLPCQWKPQLGNGLIKILHVQWQTTSNNVYEQMGADRWQAEEFIGRVEVPEQKLEAGDCSLIVEDVQFRDKGLYESFMVVDGTGMKERVFIQSVRLLVYGHRTLQSHVIGEDMVLDLHTSRSRRLVFQGRNSSEWTSLWVRGVGGVGRLEKDPDCERLTLKRLAYTDDGIYMVLDDHSLSLSTVQLTVEENPLDQKGFLEYREQAAPGHADKTRSSSSWVVWSLVTFLVVHLF